MTLHHIHKHLFLDFPRALNEPEKKERAEATRIVQGLYEAGSASRKTTCLGPPPLSSTHDGLDDRSHEN